ncbi:hypothetical protein ABZ837_10445 [Streptomyces sp. NPDC047197]|uniref:hypothetical protein n=1 Tax=Streptomyces sp. NPDC047197 TaxID=3155477 RepID=UPI0033E6BE64
MTPPSGGGGLGHLRRRVEQGLRTLLGPCERRTPCEASGENLGLSRPRLAPAVWRLVRVQPGWAACSGAARPVLCDLISARAAVLERDVSPKTAAEYKRAAIASVGVPAGLVRAHVPELTRATGCGPPPTSSG